MWLFLAFLAVPLIEIALFIQVGGAIGLWPTLAIVVVTAVLGTWLVRTQGALAIIGQLRSSFSQLDDPTEPLANGAMILIAGALLLTPGFFTDAVGFALLMPPIRAAIFRSARKNIKVQRFEMGAQGPRRDASPHGYSKGPHTTGDVIDGNFEEIEPYQKPNDAGSGWTKH